MRRRKITHHLSIVSLLVLHSSVTLAESPVEIGDRRQLFVDARLVSQLRGLRRVLHHPVRREIAIKPEHPW